MYYYGRGECSITSLGKAPLHTIRGEKCGKTTDKKIN